MVRPAAPPEPAVGVLAHANVHVESGNTDELHGWPRGGFGEFALAPADAATPLVLSLVEAYFLAHQPPNPLLEVRRPSPMDGPVVSAGSNWHRFSQIQPSFALKYALYWHMRVGGWNLRSGVKLGIDYTLYERSTTPDHAAFCAIALRPHVRGDSLPAADSQRTWQWMQRFSRVGNQVGKAICLCAGGDVVTISPWFAKPDCAVN